MVPLISFSGIISPLSPPRRLRRRWEFLSLCITERLRPHRGLKLYNKMGERGKKKSNRAYNTAFGQHFWKGQKQMVFHKAHTAQ